MTQEEYEKELKALYDKAIEDNQLALAAEILERRREEGPKNEESA